MPVLDPLPPVRYSRYDIRVAILARARSDSVLIVVVCSILATRFSAALPSLLLCWLVSAEPVKVV